MKLLGKGSLLFAALIIAVQSISAAEWRGIVPLRSTRQDVMRLFNQCQEKKERCSFSLENQDVMIIFSGWQRAFGACPKSVPTDTVLLVRIRFNTEVPMKNLKINLKTFKAFDPSSPRGIGYRAYIDEKSGLLIKSYKGQVVEFDYIASREDQAFCPWFYESPRDFVRVTQWTCCPIVIIACPPDGSSAGSRLTFLADTPDDYDVMIWTVTEGTIVSGQGTRELTVDTAGLGGRKITVTVQMIVEDDPHRYSASCVVQISAELPN